MYYAMSNENNIFIEAMQWKYCATGIISDKMQVGSEASLSLYSIP